METLRQDLRHAGRVLRRTPGATLAAVLSLAVGIGANTTLLSVAGALLLEPLPVREPGQMVALFTSESSGETHGTSSLPDYRDLRGALPALSGLVAYAAQPLNLGGGERPELVVGEGVSGNYAAVLGLSAARGRTLTEEDDRRGAAPVAVISERLWRRHFGSDPQVLGRTLDVNARALTVVGVMPASYPGLLRGLPADVWIPLALRSELRPADSAEARGSRELFLLGRLQTGATLAQVQAQLEAAARALHAAHPDTWSDQLGRGRRLTAVPEIQARLPQMLFAPALGLTGLLGVVAALVLMLACANVAGLSLLAADGRRREVAVRLALGASRGRIARQLLTESLLLASVGCLLAVALSYGIADAIAAWRPPLPVPVTIPARVDLVVLAAAAALGVLTTLAVGLAPALQASRPDLVPALKEGGAGSSGATSRSRLQRFFVAAQVAACLVLLAAGTLFLRSLAQATAIDPGFGVRQALLLSYDVSLNGRTAEEGRVFLERTLEQVAALPGVQSATGGIGLPLSLEMMRRGIWIKDGQQSGDEREQAVAMVAPGYFETMGIPIVRGRAFSRADGPGAPGVVVVNETFARRFWPGRDPVGQRLSTSGPEGAYLEVVGVARDGRYFTLGEEPRPFFYLSASQEPISTATLVVRTAGEPRALEGAVRAVLQRLDPAVPVWGVKTLEEHLGFSLAPARVAGIVLGAFGLLGLTLASVGLHALVGRSVTRRRRELGVRLALGASPREVEALVLREAGRLAAAGGAVGLVMWLALGTLLGGLLYGLSPRDPASLLGVAALLAAVVAAAAWVPARRASRIDPVAALRSE